MNPLFLMCSAGRRVAALPRVGNGTEAGTKAQDAVCRLNGDACRDAGIQGLGRRCRTLRRMAEDGRRAGRRGLGDWKKRDSKSGPDAAAEGSEPAMWGVPRS